MIRARKLSKAEKTLLGVYEQLESRVSSLDEAITDPVNKKRLPELLDYHGTLNSICAVHAPEFMLIFNDSERDYYGALENDVSKKDLSFVRSVLHPTSYMTALFSQTFFGRPQSKKFKAYWKLKGSDGRYQKFYGISGAVATDAEGLATHVLSLKWRQSDMALFHILETFSLHHLPNRTKEILNLLLSGKTIDQISEKIGLASKTIEKEVTQIYRSAGVVNRAHLLGALH